LRPVTTERLPNVPGKSITAIVVHYAPGAKSDEHDHAGCVLAYVLSGEIRSENSAADRSRCTKLAKASSSRRAASISSARTSAMQPASLLAIFIADDGATLTTVHE
jgi:hypothetical protein